MLVRLIATLGLTSVLCGAVLPAYGGEDTLPRTVLALYDADEGETAWTGRTHQRAEMPLNHLGLVVKYHDLREGLPPLSELQGVRGVLTWFYDVVFEDPSAYLQWVDQLISSGRKLVVLGSSGIADQRNETGRLSPEIQAFWRHLGLRCEDDWVGVTYDVDVIESDPSIVGFERPLGGVFPGYSVFKTIDANTRTILEVGRARQEPTRSAVIVTGKNGGYAADGYALHPGEDGLDEWLIDPFEFFREAFATDDLPKPDTTTLSGRRIFYSHIDGDGWRNPTEVAEYRRSGALSPEVILHEVFEKYPEFPVTVGPVVADIDPEWLGSSEGLRLAREIFALPNVEAGCHTYSHPLDWHYFEDFDPQESSATETLTEEAEGAWRRVQQWTGFGGDQGDVPSTGDHAFNDAYDRPRSYEIKPFNLQHEIEGAVRFVEGLLPAGKRVELYQWSGDTTPFTKAVSLTRRLGLRNINGGDTRFDREFPSYSSVAAIGRLTGSLTHPGEVQIYASNSNENTYTELWTKRYFGFIHLAKTIDNTEAPRRVKPFNLYYHMYSGQKQPSLHAVQANLDHARSLSLAPISASEFCAIGDGFFSTRIVPEGPDRWRIEERQGLATIRFDHALDRSIDWERSEGIIGQTYTQGSLYVALDDAVVAPVVALVERPAGGRNPRASRPYLVEGRWRVSRLSVMGSGMDFSARGYGDGSMSWRMPRPGEYSVTIQRAAGTDARGASPESSVAATDEQGLLQIVVPGPGITGLRVRVRRVGDR